jgi:uncharacterized membrane protein
MAKQELRTRQTNLTSPGASGQHVEQTYTVDDSFLPSPEELVAYQQINPDIVQLFIDASRKEQENRHSVEQQKISLLKEHSKNNHSINRLGMILAFSVIALGFAFSTLLIYMNKDIFGTIFAGATITSAAYIFLHHTKNKEQK